jgi:hypothetical protein
VCAALQIGTFLGVEVAVGADVIGFQVPMRTPYLVTKVCTSLRRMVPRRRSSAALHLGGDHAEVGSGLCCCLPVVEDIYLKTLRGRLFFGMMFSTAFFFCGNAANITSFIFLGVAMCVDASACLCCVFTV